MCSIAGRYALARPGPGAPLAHCDAGARIQAMLAILAPRGPDGRGVVTLGAVTLGHGRLALRDRSPRGHQPMATPDGRYALTFNGEIYNHAELRAELETAGVTFRSTCDTEVLLHALARHGETILPRLNGQFAFAFLDVHTGRLLLARDPYGINPLAYTEAPDGFWFASEPRALLVPAGPASRVADEAAIERFFLEGLTDAGERTFFRSVRYLPGGHRIVVEGGRVVACGPYAPLPHEKPAPAADFKAVLQHATALRLESDTPVGSCLSGGLDSGTIVGMAGELGGPGLPTYTAAFQDPEVDESAAAGAIARKTRASPTFVLMTPPTAEDLFRLTLEQGAPVGSFSVFAKRRVAEAARDDGVPVLLDGLGGDEILAGYPHFQAARLATLLSGLRFIRFARESKHAPAGAVKEAAYFLLPRFVRTRIRMRAHAQARAFLEAGFAARNPLPPATDFPAGSLLKGALAESLTSRGLPMLLRWADRANMAASVEGRYPFLDPDVVRAAFALPDERLLSDGWTKRALRDASTGLIPEDLRECRRKLGFGTPGRAWLGTALSGALRDHLTDGRLDARGWLAPGAGARIHDLFLQGMDRGLAMRAFMLEMWARAFLDVPHDAPLEGAPPQPAVPQARTP